MALNEDEGRGLDSTMSDTNRAYLQLKQMIISLAARPGSTIHESDLLQQLAVGRTPLREALQRLSNEGLLQIYPRRAIVVARLGVSEIRQIFEMRLILEPAAAGLAALSARAPEIEQLQSLALALSAHDARADVASYLRDDHLFHRMISSCTQNTYLIGAVDRILTVNQWLWNIYFDGRGVVPGELFPHERIVEAISAHDSPAAEAAMREHILSSKEQLLAGL